MASQGLSEKAALCQPADEKSVPPHLRCNSCSKPVFNSYQTPHGCRLCQTCVSTKLHPSEKRKCPGTTETCRDEEEEIINQRSCFPDLASRREISKLAVTCPNKDDGCKEQLKWKDVDTHLEKCDYEKVSCKQCRDKVFKSQVKSHLSDECRQRQVKCKLCSQMVVFREMKNNHENLESPTCCLKYLSLCPYCKSNSTKLNRATFVDHLNLCPEKPKDCKFQGCDTKASETELLRHYKEKVDHHLSLMANRLKQLEAAATNRNAATVTLFSRGSRQSGEDLLLLRNYLSNLDENIEDHADTRRQDCTALDITTSGLSHADLSVVKNMIDAIGARLSNLEAPNYKSFMLWKVNNLIKRRREAVNRSVDCIFSEPFFLRRNRFRFRVRLFLNGNESGVGTHVSVYLVLVQHECDGIQDWPLKANVTFRLVNLKNRADDITKTVRFDSGNQRPSSREDLSVCCGDAKFVSINQLKNSDRFVKNDCLFLEVEVGHNKTGHVHVGDSEEDE